MPAENMRPVTRTTLGSWLLRCDPHQWDLKRFQADGHPYLARWNVNHPSYRLELMQAGDPVVLWVTGGGGISGVGHVTGPVDADEAVPDPQDGQAYWIADRSTSGGKHRTLYVPVHLPFLPAPLTAAALGKIDGLDDLEVIRAAQTRNPSYLTTSEWALLQAHLPVLADADPTLERDDAVEKGAIAAVRAELKNDPTGTWTVHSVEDENCGWDLTAHRTIQRTKVFRFIEVKGRGPWALTIMLTRNELQKARDKPGWELAVVPEALGDRPHVLWFDQETAVELAQPTAYQLTLPQSRARPISS